MACVLPGIGSSSDCAQAVLAARRLAATRSFFTKDPLGEPVQSAGVKASAKLAASGGCGGRDLRRLREGIAPTSRDWLGCFGGELGMPGRCRVAPAPSRLLLAQRPT